MDKLDNEQYLYLYYVDNTYAIDKKAFTNLSNYFKSHEVHTNKTIKLSNEGLIFSHDSIQDFINYFHDQKIDFNERNISLIHYLAIFFQIPSLLDLALKYTSEKYRQIIDYFFSQIAQKYIDVNTKDISFFEEIISKNLKEYIHTDEILLLPVSSLYRILNRNPIQNQSELNDFFLKCLVKFGNDSILMFNMINFDENIDLKLKLLSDPYNKIFDFSIFYSTKNNSKNAIESELIKSVELLKIENKNNYNFISTEISKIRDEIKLIKNEILEKIKNIDDKVQKETNYINNNVKHQINECIIKQEQEKNQQTIQNHLLFDLNSNDIINSFNSQNGKIQMFIINKILEINQENKFIFKIQKLLSYLSNEQEKTDKKFNNVKFIEIQSNPIKKSIFNVNEEDNVIINQDVLEMLFNNNSLNEEFISILKNFLNGISIEIQCILENFNDIFNFMLHVKNSEMPNLIINIVITGIEKTNNTFKNKNINSVRIERDVHEITGGMDNGSFEKCTNLTDVVIGDSVYLIGGGAFYQCSSIKELIIPDSVTTIGGCAFGECNNLQKITINPYNIKDMASDSFRGCSSLNCLVLSSSIKSIVPFNYDLQWNIKEIVIPNSVTYIEKNSFNHCKSLTKINIPSSIKEIGQNSFSLCSSLTEVSFEKPSSLTLFGDSTFNECTSLKQISIPSSVISLGASTFYNCSSLEDVTFEGNFSLIEIENNVFYGCKSLKNIIIPSSVTVIGDNSFSGCSSLSYFYLPSSINEIGENAFSQCTNLMGITNRLSDKGKQTIFQERCLTIPYFVTKIKENCFYQCSSIQKIIFPNSLTEICNGAFAECNELVEISIPNSVNKICDHAFAECKKLAEIRIPDSVTNIGLECFMNCPNLQKIAINPYIKREMPFDSFKGCLSLYYLEFLSSIETIKKCDIIDLWKITEIVIPNSVNKIEERSFNECKSLRKIIIPSSVTSIGDYAFDSCDSLAEVSFDDSTNSSLISIGDYAFYSCFSLTDILIPSSVYSIGEKCFKRCYSLSTITVSTSKTKIPRNAFNKCFSLYHLIISTKYNISRPNNNIFFLFKKITISGTATIIDSNAFLACSLLEEIEIQSQITCIGKSAFNGCFSLKEINIPNTVEYIKDMAFKRCVSLKEITIPSSVCSIGRSAFKECVSLSKITMNCSIEYIAASTFEKCTSLLEISLPFAKQIQCYAFSRCTSLCKVSIPSVKMIGDSAFYECKYLREINSFSSLQKIGNYAFYGCSFLQKIQFDSSSIESIGNSTFDECHQLKEISLPSSLTTIGTRAFRYCNSLKKISFPSSVTSIGEGAFNHCESLEIIPSISSLTTINAHLFIGCSSLKQLSIPSSVTSIKSYAFRDCISLEKISIPSSIKEINCFCFKGCKNLKKIDIEKGSYFVSPSNKVFLYRVDFDGIFNYFNTHSKIEKEITITCSILNDNNINPYCVLKNSDEYIFSKDLENSWVCFEFLNYEIIPTCYTLKSYNAAEGMHHPRKWNLMGSKDNKNWVLLDYNLFSKYYLNGPNLVYTFSIDNKQNESFKYLRILQIGKNWHDEYFFCFNQIEFYGQLI